jgi:hypothetical protein
MPLHSGQTTRSDISPKKSQSVTFEMAALWWGRRTCANVSAQ